jgi:hypothetical protein
LAFFFGLAVSAAAFPDLPADFVAAAAAFPDLGAALLDLAAALVACFASGAAAGFAAA